ncbi:MULTISPECIES: flagellar biosynthesis protein FliQ [Vibrio]|jgi:flagellar biosynthetic protein FliQ|uniref:Flagellar biosynthetic protein FliQ n=3 Tax=Vibrio TaxID=662 RepID=A0A240EL34_9VIBR|nr:MULTISPECIES: flagellar biosynthesis protein FliQ [Vibrio]ASI90217.1 flagellar biosynthetic protein FliQ [Vibrio mediterranei]AYV22173.1 flagellar biosynthetic protein FliQ [Vibrio mediterranei]EDL51963.1 flagellar biosynthetic protein [Vibrio mediterranei AK1]KFA95777.1 flagellar biosynthesis protein FliQ [Vibrio sp. ER1A]MCF4175832.1 flagellar biosynthesis protein FliQ [Vibrio sp. McD22-P3]
MSPEEAVTLVSQAIWVIILMVSVLIVPSLIVGLVVAIFQAVTQVNEQTLSFLPRLLVTLLSIILAGHWLLQEISDLFLFIFDAIPTKVG